MPVDAGGNATRPPTPMPVSGQTADAPQVNVPINDIYSILNMLMFLDGRKPLRGNIPMNGYRARGAGDAEQPQDYVTLAQIQAMMSGIVTPPGSMQTYTISSSNPPPGWIFANGQTLQRSVFPNLWAAVQTGNNLAASEGAKTHGQYGPGDGSTTFTVPNLASDGGYFIRPLASGRGIGSVQGDEIKSHTHAATVNDPGHSHSYFQPTQAIFTGAQFTGYLSRSQAQTSVSKTGITVSIGASGGSETRPKNIAYPMIIKS